MNPDKNTIEAGLRGTFVEKEINRTNRIWLMVSFVLVLISSSWIFIAWHPIINTIFGPLQVQSVQLSNERYLDSLNGRLISIDSSEEYDTGMIIKEGFTGYGPVKARLVLLPVGQKYLLVKRNPKATGQHYTGVITEVADGIKIKIANELKSVNPDSATELMPYMLDETYSYEEIFGSFFIWVVFFLTGLIIARNILKRIIHPTTHPLYHELLRHGNAIDIAHQIDADLKGEVYRFSKTTVTNAWIIFRFLLTNYYFKISEVVSITKFTYTIRIQHVIPVGKGYGLWFVDSSGKKAKVVFGRNEKRVDDVMAELSRRVPHVRIS